MSPVDCAPPRVMDPDDNAPPIVMPPVVCVEPSVIAVVPPAVPLYVGHAHVLVVAVPVTVNPALAVSSPADVIVPEPDVEIFPDVEIAPEPEIDPVTVNTFPDGIVKPPFAAIAPVTANVPSTVVPEFALPMVVAPVPVELVLIFTV